LKKQSTKTMKKVLATTLLAGMLAAPNVGFAATALPLSDISQNANKNAILKLNYAGVLKGYTDGTFKPDKEVTRAEFAKVAVLALGYTEDQVKLFKGATKFKDLPADHWATGYINLAVANGIIKGYPDGTFKPNNSVKVAEALTVYVQGLKINVSGAVGPQWYYPYLLEANKTGIYDTTELPTSNAKRDVIAKYTDKFMETSVYANGAYYDEKGNANGTYKKLPIVKASVASYDKAEKKLKLVGQEGQISLADDAQVYGNIVLGAEVEYIVKNNKIVFINVVTEDANIVEGIVKTGLNFTTAVGDEKKFKAIVNGKEVVFEVENGVSVSRTQIGYKFTAIIGKNGKITSITITKNASTGVVEKVSTVSGSKPKKEIKVDGVTYELAADATISGKAHPLAVEAAGSFSDIKKGDLVELTFDLNGKVVDVEYTKLSIIAPITIDTDENTIKIDRFEYEVEQDTELYVDEEEVSELDDLDNNKLAILTFDEEGNLIKVEQGTGVASNKLVSDTTAYVAGTPALLATIKVDGKVYDILPTAKLTIDGKTVSATTIKADQLNDYRITTWKYNVGTNDIVELTAEKQTVKGYVTDQTSKTVTVNGTEYQLAAGVEFDEDAEDNDLEYTLVLNNDGKVKAFTGAPKTVSGVVDDVTVVDEDGSVVSAKVKVNGKTYSVSDKDALDNVDEFEFVTLTLDRDGKVTDSAVQGTKAVDSAAFKGIETRISGEKYVFFTNLSTSLKLATNAKVKYYDGSDMEFNEIKNTDEVDLWINNETDVYLIVVNKR